MKTFEIERHIPEFGDSIDATVDGTTLGMVKPREVVIPHKEITIKYDYPLDGTFKFTHESRSKRGWTRVAVFKAIQSDYRKMYATEEDPGHLPGMLNRAASEGPYGIWGHDIGDLVIEGVSYNPKTHMVSLSIGS